MGLRMQSTDGFFHKFYFFPVAQVVVRLRKQFINNLFCPLGPLQLVLIVIIIIIPFTQTGLQLPIFTKSIAIPKNIYL